MLNGIDPIIIFHFSKKLSTTLSGEISKIPLVSRVGTFVELPPIPIYLSANLTGLFIESEDKNVDIETYTESKTDGTAPAIDQKGVASTISINILAKKNSIGIALLSAMIDVLYEKVSSNEYSITYLHGATTIFRAALTKFQASQNSENDLLNINIELTRGAKNPSPVASIPEVPRVQAVVP